MIASGERQPHINVFGGEDRFWLGPEGGQYSIYFKSGDPFDLGHWHVPAAIDWEPWSVTAVQPRSVVMQKAMNLQNYQGTSFLLTVDREVRLIGRSQAEQHLGVSIGPLVRLVALESLNTVTNTGEEAWIREHGLLSIWILGMYHPSAATTVVIPYVSGTEEERASVVNADYFGQVPSERLREDGEVVYFRGDGAYRSKIGLSKARSSHTFGSYDGERQLLTLVQYSLPDGNVDYVNSMRELQEDPFVGDVINSYNDGPPAPGLEPLGPFYELETSSPALALEPGASYTHMHRTVHLQGDEAALDAVAVATLGKSLSEIRTAFDR